MKNKILIQLIIPEVDLRLDVFIPVSKKVGEILNLFNKAILDISNGIYIIDNKKWVYDGITGEKYDINVLIKDTNIRNGTSVILI